MKILFLTSRLPYPLNKGDKLRAYYQIREISKFHDVILVSISEDDTSTLHISHLQKYTRKVFVIRIRPFERYCSLIKSLNSEIPLSVAWFYSKRIQIAINKIIEDEKPNLIFCQLTRMHPYLKSHNNTPKVIDYMDAFGVGMQRRSHIVDIFNKQIYKLEGKRMTNYETDVAKYYDRLLIISDQDKSMLALPTGLKVDVVPNGVDQKFFEIKPSKKFYDIVFVGNMSYLPNINAAEYIVHQILPILDQKNTKVLFAGVDPDERVKRLSNDHVTVSGYVDDIREAYVSGKIFVAPLFYGTGQQNKILEAMALKLPCVTTTAVNNAINASNGEQIFLADDAKSFSTIINKLLTDHDSRNKIGENASLFVKENYQWEEIGHKLNRIFAQIIQ